MADISEEVLEAVLHEISMDYRETRHRKRLYEQGIGQYPDNLPKLAMEWFHEIANNVGPLGEELWFSNRRPSEESREGLPPRVYCEDPLETPPLDEVYRHKEGDSQTLLIWVGDDRAPEGYKKMAVKDEFFKVDLAVLAALTALEADLLSWESPRGPSGERERDFVDALLKYYRPEFEELAPREQGGLAQGTLDRIYTVLKALRDLMAYLEYGKAYEGITKAPLENPRLDVRAAELKHIDGLKAAEIGERLGIEKPKLRDSRTGEPREYDERYDKEKYARKVRGYTSRGERILKGALGEEGFKKHVENSKAEKEQWESLDGVERLIRRMTDIAGRDFHVVHSTGSRGETIRGVLRRLLAGDQRTIDRLLEGDRTVLEGLYRAV